MLPPSVKLDQISFICASIISCSVLIAIKHCKASSVRERSWRDVAETQREGLSGGVSLSSRNILLQSSCRCNTQVHTAAT